jgi:general secretion pathway protein K
MMANRPRYGCRPQLGAALLMVLWGLVLLSSIAVSFSYAVRNETRIARNQLERTQALSLAEAGVAQALAWLLATRGAPGEQPAHWAEEQFVTGRVTWSLADASGRVSLNHASPALLERLLTGFGVAPELRPALVDALLDWRDRDQLHRLHGAEDADYRHAGRAYGAADRPFTSVAELQQVLGISPELYARLTPVVVTQGEHRGVNPRHAPAELLYALGADDEEQISAYLGARTADAHTRVQADGGLGQVSPYFTDETGTYRIINATGRTASRTRVDLEVVVNTRPGNLEVLVWRQIPAIGYDHD